MCSPKVSRRTAALLAVALAVTGCSDGGQPEADGAVAASTTTAPPSSTTTEAVAVPVVDAAAAFDQGVAVQDVILRFEMAVVTDDGERHVLGDVRDLALEGAAEVIDLGAGVGLRPTDAITGQLVDPTGAVVDGLSVDYGLLVLGAPAVAAAEEALADEPAAAPLLPSGPGELLVEIITTDPTRRTHVSEGDRAVMDITAVGSVQPGDRLVQRYLFAQTLPGDPAQEKGLDPYELFASRWAAGLIRVAGDDDGPVVFEDGTADAVEGSTLAALEVKQGLLLAARMRGERDGFLESRVALSRSGEQPVDDVGGVEGVGGGSVVLYDQAGDDPGTDGIVGPNQREITTDEFGMLLATLRGKQACQALLPEMLVRNRLVTRLDDVGDAISRTGISDEIDLGGVELSEDGEPSPEDTARFTIPQTLYDVCDPPPAPPDLPEFPFIPTGGTFGDIRLRTLDGLQYDHQATGEFLLFESPTTSVHIRTEPAVGSDAASVGTATALRLTTSSLSMHVDGTTYLDGEPLDLQRGVPTDVDGVAVVDALYGWGIVFADGTQVHVERFSNQLVTVVNAATLPTGGLLGDGNGDERDDLLSRDGELLTVEEGTGRDRARFYDVFVASWRLDDEESLLHHRPGETAAGFVIDGFPATTVLLDDLDPEERAEAEAVCLGAGVRTEDGLRDCTLDVAITGDESFGFATFVFEVASVPPVAPSAPGSGVAPSGGDAAGLTIGTTDIELGADPESRMPNTPFNWSCEADDGSYTLEQRHTVSAAERYAVEIRLDATLGDPRFTLIVERNGEPWAWVLDWIDPPPGEIDVLEVDGETLRASGTVFVNDPPDPVLSPLAAVPEDGRREPFTLTVSCR